MSGAKLTRMNLLLEAKKLRQLGNCLRSRSNSEAVRPAIDEHLGIRKDIRALRKLNERGGLPDVLGLESSTLPNQEITVGSAQSDAHHH